MCFARIHSTNKSCNTGETKSKPLSKSRRFLKLLTAVYKSFGLYRFMVALCSGIERSSWTCSDFLDRRSEGEN
jgi:hypothetical protein